MVKSRKSKGRTGRPGAQKPKGKAKDLKAKVSRAAVSRPRGANSESAEEVAAAAVAQTHEPEAKRTTMPFWARAPLAAMDFWFSRPERQRSK
jgi:hypothetical protein